MRMNHGGQGKIAKNLYTNSGGYMHMPLLMRRVVKLLGALGNARKE